MQISVTKLEFSSCTPKSNCEVYFKQTSSLNAKYMPTSSSPSLFKIFSQSTICLDSDAASSYSNLKLYSASIPSQFSLHSAHVFFLLYNNFFLSANEPPPTDTIPYEDKPKSDRHHLPPKSNERQFLKDGSQRRSSCWSPPRAWIPCVHNMDYRLFLSQASNSSSLLVKHSNTSSYLNTLECPLAALAKLFCIYVY